MDAVPSWFAQLTWSVPRHIADVNADRNLIPDFPGCYVFMKFPGPPALGRTLYVGQASVSLRSRIAVYLVDIAAPKTSEGHKGKGFVLEARSKKGDHGIYLQWVQYGGNNADLDILEASLINYLNPPANDREDDTRHPLLGHSDTLHPDLLG